MQETENPVWVEKGVRKTRWGVRLLLIGGICLLLLIPCFPFLAIPIDVVRSGQQKHRLRFETDHAALLTASRQMMRDLASQEIEDPENDPRVPQIIRDLGPTYMRVSASELRVELHGGFDHYGFVAYADDSEPDEGNGKLTDGLRYYSE